MALTLSEALREARSIPVFNGTSEYSISNYLRDVNTVLSLTAEENRATVGTILTNKLQGKALQVVESLIQPSFTDIVTRLTQEFGVKESYVTLRNEAMNVFADNIEELHHKLRKILHRMNTKYLLEGEIEPLYNPVNNDKLIFDCYLNFLPFNIKTLLLQNNIDTIDKSHSYYLENNLIKDIVLKNKNKSNDVKNNTFKQFQPNYMNSRTNKQFRNNQSGNTTSNAYNTNSNGFRYQNGNNNFKNNQNSGQFRNNNNSGNFRNSNNFRNFNNSGYIRNNNANNVEPMDVDNLEITENYSLCNSTNILPLINVNINGDNIVCLVDSGAATTLGDFDTFKNLGIVKKLQRSLLLRTLHTSQEILEEAIVDMPTEFNCLGEKMSVKLLDLKHKTFRCILGMNILSPLGAVIDFINQRLVVKDNFINFIKKNENISYINEESYDPPKDLLDVCHIEKQEFNEEFLVSEHLNKEEKNIITKFLKCNKATFYQDGQLLSASNCVKHQILTQPHRPLYSKNYRYPFALENEIKQQIEEMLANGIIRHSKSPYNSPLWVVPKKLDNSGKKKWRIVVDFRKLNEITIDDKFPLPNIESLFEKLGRAQYFSVLDLAKGFHQILMDEADIEKTAFSSSSGHFEFVRMPFGLKNAPSTFQRMMNNILVEHINKICVIYMDDILVFSTSLSEHIESLNKIFKCLNENNLKIQFDKCKFLCRETNFLGHVISSEGIKPNKDKVEVIRNLQIPKSVKEIKSFLGISGYYRKFIKNYSHIASPIIKYLKKGAKIDINDTLYINAFNKLKKILISPPLLVYPDMSKVFVLTTDSSDFAIGAVLSQKGKPICYASRTLNGYEKKYFTLEKELLAIVWAVKYFRPYLFGRKFIVQSDHQPLNWLFSMKEPNSRILRWRMILSEYDYKFEYLAGKENKVADFLSRLDTENQRIEDEAYDIKSLFENSISTVHSSAEELNEHFIISYFIVNKYNTQIRLLKTKTNDFEKLYNKYNVIYVSEKDLQNNTYLNDLFRKFLCKGSVGIYSELDDTKYNMLQEKLIALFSNKSNIKFTKCTELAEDIKTKEEILEIIERVHINGNHRGVLENLEEIKTKYFYPNLKKIINKYINSCRVCNECKYDRNPFKKQFNHTETPCRPNQIVHIDIFHVKKAIFLTSIDRFTKIASAHMLSDKNMCTIKVKLQERISWLGKPEMLIMDNEFNNALIKLFCNENQIIPHFTIPHSHTGNSDVERFHSTLLENIRVILHSNDDEDIEEIVLKAIGFYNNTIHSTLKIKPMDFINKTNIDLKQIQENMQEKKQKVINKINEKRENVPTYDENNLYVKNPYAQRSKTTKRYTKYNKNNPNDLDLANIKRPKKNL